MIGLCSVTFRETPVEDVINLAKEANLQTIEWGSDHHLPEGDLDHARKVSKLMEEAGLTTSSYGS